MATLTQAERARAKQSTSKVGPILGRISTKLLVTLLGLAIMLLFLMPLGYMLATAFKASQPSPSRSTRSYKRSLS